MNSFRIIVNRYTPAVKSVGYYPRITPGYLPPAKVAVTAPAYTLNTPAYSAGIVSNLKYASPSIASTAGYSTYGSYGSSANDASYSNGAYYSSPAKVLAAPFTKYVSTPAVTTTFAAASPTIAPVAC